MGDLHSKLLGNSSLWLKLDKVMSTLYEDLDVFLLLSQALLSIGQSEKYLY